jgi:hypothetical protein
MSLASYTDYEIDEFRRCKRDPVYFIKKYFNIHHPKNGTMLFNLYPYQERLVWAYHINTHNVTLASRQTGASLCLVAYALWASIFATGKHNTLLVSNKLDDARYLLNTIRFAIDRLPHWVKPKLDIDNKSTIAFYGEKVKILTSAVTGDAARGISVDLFLWDNAMYAKTNQAFEMWDSVAPCLVAGAKCIVTNSGTKLLQCAEANIFYDLWRGALRDINNGMTANFVAWYEPPGRGVKFEEAVKRYISESEWRREYLCEFVVEE